MAAAAVMYRLSIVSVLAAYTVRDLGVKGGVLSQGGAYH